MSKNNEENLKEWFVLFDGQLDDGEEANDPMAVAFPGHMEEDALTEFDDNIKLGLADKDTGQYLVKLSNVKEEQYESLSDADSLNDIVLSNFKGFKSEVVKEYKTGLSDWNADSLGVNFDEEYELDNDGWLLGNLSPLEDELTPELEAEMAAAEKA